MLFLPFLQRYRLPWRSPEQVVMDTMENALSKEWQKENTGQLEKGEDNRDNTHFTSIGQSADINIDQ